MPVAKPLDLPFDPIERAAEIWAERFGPADAMAAVTSIMRAQQILLAGLDGLLRPYGLTFARYEALVLLAFSRTGALPLRVIGERLMVHPTSVTNTVDRLERDGLVRRRPNPRDGRGTLAEITPEECASITVKPGTPKYAKARETLIGQVLDRRPKKVVEPTPEPAPPPVPEPVGRRR